MKKEDLVAGELYYLANSPDLFRFDRVVAAGKFAGYFEFTLLSIKDDPELLITERMLKNFIPVPTHLALVQTLIQTAQADALAEARYPEEVDTFTEELETSKAALDAYIKHLKAAGLRAKEKAYWDGWVDAYFRSDMTTWNYELERQLTGKDSAYYEQYPDRISREATWVWDSLREAYQEKTDAK